MKNKEVNFKILRTEEFKKLFFTLEKNEQKWIVKVAAKLSENPTGKILTYDWFREKKYLNKRLYYLIDEKTKKILFIGFATKKKTNNF